MSATETTGPLRGSLTKTDGNEIITRGVKATIVLVAGDAVTFDSNGFIDKADETSDNDDGLGMVLETITGGAADGDEDAQVAIGNTYVNMDMGGAVVPMQRVKVVADNDLESHTVTVIADVHLSFGRYLRHPKEEKTPTDAANGDVGVIRLGAD